MRRVLASEGRVISGIFCVSSKWFIGKKMRTCWGSNYEENILMRLWICIASSNIHKYKKVNSTSQRIGSAGEQIYRHVSISALEELSDLTIGL